MKELRVVRLLALALIVGCIGDKSPTGVGPAAPSKPSEVISDGAHGGNPDFWFLPPMVPLPLNNPNFKIGTFTNALKPSLSIVICELSVPTGLPTASSPCVGSPVKTFPKGTVQLVNLPLRQNGWWSLFNLPPDGFYYVLWDTRSSNLSVSKYYRIKVFAEGRDEPLGIADVDPMSSLREWKYTLTNEVIQLIDDVLLPIPFRVEEGALCYQISRCSTVTVTNGSTTPQLVKLDEGAGSVAGVEFPAGNWLPPGGPQSVVVTIRRVPGSESTDGLRTRTTPCHAALPLYQQLNGCFSFTTTPALLPYPPTGHQFLLKVRVAVCYSLQDSEDPREKFAELYASGPGEPPHALEDVSDAGILGADSRNCPEPPPIITLSNSKSLSQFASAGWQLLKRGANSVFGVKTAYAVDLGLGGYVLDFSNIGPVIPAHIEPFGPTSVTFEQGLTVNLTAAISGSHTHDGGEHSPNGINKMPITFAVAEGNGVLRRTEESPPVSQVTVNTDRLFDIESFIDGIAVVSWTPPTTPGVYHMTATGPATDGPVVYTATITPTLLNTLIGTWDNENTTPNNLVNVAFSRDGDAFMMQAFGQCSPTDCDWGLTSVDTSRWDSDQEMTAVWDQGFAIKTVTVKWVSLGRLQVTTHADFTDADGRPDYTVVEFFHPVT